MCNSCWGSADSAFGACWGVASPESLSCAPCHPPVCGRFEEIRDCKGIKISLGMSLQRGPLTLTFWDLRLGHVSFLPSLFFAVPVSSTMGLPLRWIFFTFCLYRGSFAELGSCCAWPLPHGGCFSQVISESRHHRCHESVCSSVLCLITTKIWSDGH